jgi:hypothetical protein
METFPQIPEWVEMEHKVQQILTEQELHGWYFDERSAYELESELRSTLESLSRTLRERHPFVAGSEFTPRRANKTQGYFNGCTFTRLKDFNPTSRDHIAWILSKLVDADMKPVYGWEPKQLTDTGKAVIDEVVLKEIGTPIALDFFKMLELTKQLGMLSEGVNAWQKLSINNRIHHHCSVATNTYRCAHRNPNLAQTPADERFRRLFKPTPGLCMVGADLSGIELRMFAHYLARYDGGSYGKILLNGDIHQVNADRVGVSRSDCKRIQYAILYGAGNEKIGLTYDPQLSPETAKRKGAKLRKAFLDAVEGLQDLVVALKAKVQAEGYINSIDGRSVPVDGPHKSLNYLLQSGAGIVARRWLLLANDEIKKQNIDAHQLAFVHDELQFEVSPAQANDLMQILEHTARLAGEFYNLRVPIAAEATQGSSWADTH